MITGSAKLDKTRLATGDRDRRCASDGRQQVADGIALPVVAKHDQQLRRQQLAGSWQRVEEWRIRMLAKESLDDGDGLLLLTYQFVKLFSQPERVSKR